MAPNTPFRRSLRQVFEDAHYDVLEAADGMTARRLLELWEAAAIVIDGSTWEGWHLVAAFKRRSQELPPLVFLTDDPGARSIPTRVVPKPNLAGELAALADVMEVLVGPARRPPNAGKRGS